MTDYPAASDIAQTWLSCKSYRPGSDLNSNRAAFCEPAIDRLMERALTLQASQPETANQLWAQVDREIVDRAPWLPTVNLKTIDFVAKRVGDYQFHPQWGLLLDQLWVKR